MYKEAGLIIDSFYFQHFTTQQFINRNVDIFFKINLKINFKFFELTLLLNFFFLIEICSFLCITHFYSVVIGSFVNG